MATKKDDGRRSPIVPHGSDEHRQFLGVDLLDATEDAATIKKLEAQLRVPPVVATRKTSVMHASKKGDMVVDGWRKK